MDKIFLQQYRPATDIAAPCAREQMNVAAAKIAVSCPFRDDQQIVEFTQTFRPKPEK
jgi:hypothetical protein